MYSGQTRAGFSEFGSDFLPKRPKFELDSGPRWPVRPGRPDGADLDASDWFSIPSVEIAHPLIPRRSGATTPPSRQLH